MLLLDVINDESILRFACEELGRKLEHIGRNSAINLNYPLENRMSSYILKTALNDEEAFDVPLIQLASLLGTSYRHLLRTVKQLQEIGMIRKTKNGYCIVNRSLLQQMAADLYE